MILIFFGPPGAGKGTQAALLAKHLKILHLSTGDILRKKLLESDSLSKKLRQIIDVGNLVSDEVLNEIIASRLSENDCKNGFILDGYPRTIAQMDFLSTYLINNNLFISKIFELNVNEKLIIDRIKSRSFIENREDDKDSIIKTRIVNYLLETKPLLDFYKQNFHDNFHIIDGNQEIEIIQQDILKFIKK